MWVFCASLADVFDNEVPDEWRTELFDLIRRCRNLRWQLVTKRIGNASKRLGEAFKQQRHRGVIALTNVGPIIHIVVEMFRIGTGIQLKTFSTEAAAREWLRAKGIAA